MKKLLLLFLGLTLISCSSDEDEERDVKYIDASDPIVGLWEITTEEFGEGVILFNAAGSISSDIRPFSDTANGDWFNTSDSYNEKQQFYYLSGEPFFGYCSTQIIYNQDFSQWTATKCFWYPI